MKRYIGKRTITGILIIIVAICLNFTLIHAAPGDPISILAGQESPSPEMIAALQAKYSLDQPKIVQFFMYVGNLARGDMGESILSGRPVIEMIGERIGPTLMLTLSTSILALIIGTALGIYCARHAGSKVDNTISGISYVFDSMPSFWLGMMLILIFASTLQILPTSGMVDLRAGHTGIARVFDIFP